MALEIMPDINVAAKMFRGILKWLVVKLFPLKWAFLVT